MQDGDCGSGCVEPMVQLGALTGFVFEFLSQSGNFIVFAGLARREAVTFGDAAIPFGQYPDGPVHGGAASAGFFPEVVFWPDPKNWSTFLRESIIGACMGAYRARGGSAGSVSGVEFERHTYRADDSGHGLPACGLGAARVGHALGDDAQRFGELDAGQMRAQAVMRAAAEA